MNKQNIYLIAFVALGLFTLSGCVSTQTSNSLAWDGEVRNQSYADNTLFKDLLFEIGGVGFADEVLHPDSINRRLVKIEVITPYNGKNTGEEKWTINHDQTVNVTYLVKLIPDGSGGTYFSVGKIDQ